MADLKKLAMGRKAFTGMKKGKPDAEPEKPAKSLEESCKEEIGEVEATFRAKIAKEDKRKIAATDSENWFCVYFETREAKERFLRKYGLDKTGDKYLSGNAVDRILNRRTNPAKDGHRR